MKKTNTPHGTEPVHPGSTGSPLAPYRILLVEEHPIVCHGMTALINSEGDLMVCGVAHDYEAALEYCGALNPDLVILGLSLKARRGVDLLKDLSMRRPGQKMLVFPGKTSGYSPHLHSKTGLRAT